MDKGDGGWARAPFVVVFSDCLSLGLFLWWLTFGHAGVPVAIEGPLDAQQLHGLAVRFAIGAVFLWLSFGVRVLRGTGRRAAAAAIVALLGNVV